METGKSEVSQGNFSSLNLKKFESGAVRQNTVAGQNSYPLRYSLISYIGLRRLAATYGEGSQKYGDHNWEKGIDVKNLLDHTLAHINEYISGDTSEDHLAHATWGLFAIMHMEDLKPEMQNLPTRI